MDLYSIGLHLIVTRRIPRVDGAIADGRLKDRRRELSRSGMDNFQAIAGRISIEFPCRGNRGRLWAAEMELPDCFHRAVDSTFRGCRVFDSAASRQPSRVYVPRCLVKMLLITTEPGETNWRRCAAGNYLVNGTRTRKGKSGNIRTYEQPTNF